MPAKGEVLRPTLGGLAFACYVYGSLTGYDTTFDNFRARLNGSPHLDRNEDRLALLSWLNQWGCRLPNAHHRLLADQLSSWYERYRPMLPADDKYLQDLSDEQLLAFASPFSALVALGDIVPYRGGKTRFRGTAASKTLFSLQPGVFVAWDGPMRTRLDLGQTGQDYVQFLVRVRDDLRRLGQEAEAQGVPLDGLPGLLGRPQRAPADLVNQYYWVTLTRGLKPPDGETLDRWVDWS